MSPEEKQAIQSVLMDEFIQRTEKEPTLLFDVLMSNQGFQFVVQVLQRRRFLAQQGVTMTEQLLRAMNGTHYPGEQVQAPVPMPAREEVA